MINAKSLLACVNIPRERAVEAGRLEDVRLIDLALQGDVEASVRAMIGTVNVTPAEMRLLIHLETFTRDSRGCPPTYGELGRLLNVSKVTVHEAITNLHRKGVIQFEKYTSRSIRILPKGSVGPQRKAS